MAPLDPQLLENQYLYVPWQAGTDTMTLGATIGLYVAREHRAHLTVACPLKGDLDQHPLLAKQTVVTERSGYIANGGVVLAWWPTRKLMGKLNHLKKSVVILVEWPSEDYEAWAKLRGAYNVLTGERMSAGLSDAATAALDGIVWDGYNGWHDSIAATLTTAHARTLAEMGAYDRAVIIEYAAQRRTRTGIQRLEKILDRFERSTGLAA